MKFLKYLNNNFLFKLVLTRNYRRPATINLSRWMSQHNEERNLENILPLLLETIEEDDAKLDVEGEHLLLTNTHNTRTPEESTLARAVVSVSVATGETMEEVFTVVYPPLPKAPGVQRSWAAAGWGQPKPGWCTQKEQRWW